LLDGKEGVSGSSPEEGSAKAPQIGAFSLARTYTISSVRWIWSPLWSLQVDNARGKGVGIGRIRRKDWRMAPLSHADSNRIRTLDTNTAPVASTPVKAA
jgi:hypothetical protein